MTGAGLCLDQIAAQLGEPYRGDPRTRVTRIADLRKADADCLSFLGDRKYRNMLAHTGAGIVADSDPEAEYAETLAKAGGFFAALECVEQPDFAPSLTAQE